MGWSKEWCENWQQFERLIRKNFGVQWSNPLVLTKWMAMTHEPNVPAELFITECRSLLSHFSDRAQVSEYMLLDMVYTKLHVNHRVKILRENVNSFEELIDRCRDYESAWRSAGLFQSAADDLVVPFNSKASSNTVKLSSSSAPQSVFVNSSPTASPKLVCPVHAKSTNHTWENCNQNPASPKFKPKSSNKPANSTKQPNSSLSQPTSSNSIAPSSTNQQSATASASPPPITCFKCHQVGHISTNCPNAASSNNAGPHVASIYINMPGSRKRMYAMTSMNDITTKVMLDPGSSDCILDHRSYDLLKDRCAKSDMMDCVVKMANGQEIPSKCYTVMVNLTMGVGLTARTFDFPFLYTLDCPFETSILGLDFFEFADLDVDYKRRHWCFRDNPECKFPDVSSIETADVEFSLKENEADALDEAGKKMLQDVIAPFSEVFEDFGPPTTLGVHRIQTGNAEPIASYAYPIPAKRRLKVQEMLVDMQENGIIEPCESAWAAPLIIVQKPSGDLRPCVDYRKLNAVTKTDRYPMPTIEQLLFRTDKRNFVSLLDLKSGFWQIPVAEEDRDKTAFVCEFGLFRYLRMPFGLKGAPATFQRAMDAFARSIPTVRVHAYLDDLIVISPTFNQHLKDLQTVFEQMRKMNLRVNRDKCQFVCQQFKYLGHIVTTEGIQTDPSKVSAIAELPAPRNVKQVQSFVSSCSWYRRFIPNFAKIAKPLTDLTKKKLQWTWGQDQQNAFDELKRLITSAPCLAPADDSLPFFLYTDASNYAIGAMLCQKTDDKGCRAIEYASRLLLPAERNYSTTEREALAIVWAMERFRGYIECNHVTVMTDHQALKWLMNIKSPQGRLARWALKIQGYDAEIAYISGSENDVADMLSRPPVPDDVLVEISALEVSFESASVANLRAQQLADPEIAKIITVLEASSPPPIEFDRWTGRGFILSQGILFKCSSDDELEDPQLYAPKEMRPQILKDCHNNDTSGHLGIRRTFARVAQKFYWPGMQKDITDHVRFCSTCQRYKPSNQPPPGLLQTPAPQRRFETVAVDLFGPLPITPRGNRWILSVEDIATRYVEFFPLQEATAEACAITLVNEYFLRYGLARKLISDNGTQFVSFIMQYTAERFGIKQNLIPVHHPQSNPVERKHRDLKTILAIAVQQNHQDWDSWLPATRFAMNTAITQATGFSPSYLVFASEPRNAMSINNDIRPISTTENVTGEIVAHFKCLEQAMQCARDTIALDQDRRRASLSEAEAKLPVFNVGDKVMVKNYALSSSAKGLTDKFFPRRDGPYEIVTKCSPTSYEIAAPDRLNVVLGKYHVIDMELYKGQDGVDDAVMPKKKRGRPRKNPETNVSPSPVASASGGVVANE